MKVTFGRVGGVLVLAFMSAWRLLPEPEMRTLTLAGDGMVGVCLGSAVRFSMVLRMNSLTWRGPVTCKSSTFLGDSAIVAVGEISSRAAFLGVWSCKVPGSSTSNIRGT